MKTVAATASRTTKRRQQPLSDKTALVTGAGSGLGAAIAGELASAGCRVLCTDVEGERVEEVARALDGCSAVLLDVRDADQIAKVWDAIGEVDILVNNAGVDHTLPLTELSLDQIDQVLEVNLRGPFLMSREAMTRWSGRGSGEIVNICSTAAKRAWPNAAAYHASKWGLLGLSHAIHTEARKRGIRVTAVVVGGMRTPFILERFPETPLENLQDPGNVAAAVRSAIELPPETVVPELMVVPMAETSWP